MQVVEQKTPVLTSDYLFFPSFSFLYISGVQGNTFGLKKKEKTKKERSGSVYSF